MTQIAKKTGSKRPPAQKIARQYYNMAITASQNGKAIEALKYAFLAHENVPKNHHYRLFLSDKIKNVSFQKFSPDLKAALLTLLKTDGLETQNLWKPWLSILLCDPAMKEFQNLYESKSYNAEKLEPVLQDPYFSLALERMIIFDMRFEYAIKQIYTLFENRSFTSQKLFKTLKRYNKLTEGFIFPILQDDRKQSIETNLKTLSLPDNIVHEDVKNQYEENPYPRWINCDVQPAPDETANSKHSHLIAGCGTGYGTCLTALRYPKAKITAIDLSLASLSYAQKKAKELNLKNIVFYQADILDLMELNEQFDLIECSGVLHHMKDPVSGWRSLLSKLKPEGKMHIGLYSELARQDVTAARELIAANGFPPTSEGISEARDMIIRLPDDAPAKGVVTRRDFYSLSSCRDLIFHVQEKCFTIEKIKTALETLELKFQGFDVPKPMAKTYTNQFPDDHERLNLDNWHLFEETNPDTFRGMYQFWCKRK